MQSLTVSKPMRLDCLLATFALLGMMKGNDPDVGDFIIFFLTHEQYMHIFPPTFHEGFYGR